MAKKRKPRTPYGYRMEMADGTILERRLFLPESWPYRDRLVELDEQYGIGGAWVDAIDSVFPSDWLREQVDGAHEIAGAMSWDWPIATRNIAEVADAIVAMRQARDGSESVAKRLQVHEQYLGALFEARVARIVRDAGLPFTFGSSKGAGGADADLHIDGVLPFVVEVKYVENAFRADVLQAITDRVSLILPGRVPLGTRVVFDWSADEVLAIEEGAEAAAHLNRIASKVLAQLRLSLDGSCPEPREIHVSGAGVVRLAPNAASDPQAISFDTATPPHINERRLASRVRRAARQIGPGVPGVMFLCAEPDVCCGECTAELVSGILGESGHSCPQLAGAIVFVSTRNDAVIEETWPVPNPFADVNRSTLPFPEARAPMQRVRFANLADRSERLLRTSST